MTVADFVRDARNPVLRLLMQYKSPGVARVVFISLYFTFNFVNFVDIGYMRAERMRYKSYARDV